MGEAALLDGKKQGEANGVESWNGKEVKITGTEEVSPQKRNIRRISYVVTNAPQRRWQE